MKIFGYEITKPAAMAQPNPGVGSVSVQKDLQETLPSLPLKSSFPRQELGDSGTRILHGIVVEEYNPQLQGVPGIKIYDEMRKSDGTVRAAVLVVTLPIRRAEWFVKPAGTSPQDIEIANFVEHALFDWIEDMTWDDILRQALLMVPFGVMVFEKVYGVKTFEGKDYVTLKKLAPRLPKSILQWELPDHTFGIQQIRQDGVMAMIPGSKLMIFVNEREGNNWWGTSMLRAAYKHWYFKNTFYKIDAIAFERQGIGVPIIHMPAGYTVSDEKKATQAMQNLRANENAYLVLPIDYEFEFANMGANTTRDPGNSIMHHNREIVKSVLAQFLELGAQKAGSHALSEDHTELFLKSIESIANSIIAEFNKKLIPELVDLNYTGISVYPVLDYAGINKVNMEILGKAYADLVTAGALTPTNDDEQYLRGAMGLPPRSQEDIDAEALGEPTMEELENHVDIRDDNEPDEVDDTKVDTAVAEVPVTKAKAKKDKTTTEVAIKKKPVAKVVSKKAKASEPKKLKRTFDDGKGFMSWRPFTFAEDKVSWQKIQDTMDQMEANFSQEAKDMLHAEKDAFMVKLHSAMDTNDQKAIAELEMKFINDYKALLKDAMKKGYEYGKNNVSTEMGVQAPSNTADSLANIDLMADTIANKTAIDLETKAKIASANALQQNKTALQAAGLIDQSLEDAIETAIGHTAGVIISQSINQGRNDVFQRNLGMIKALQRSEVLDEKTCDFCLSMDSLTIEPTSQWASADTFHENCRGIWVEILNDEQGADDMEITDIPDEIGDLYGGQPNSIVQPRAPIVRDGSAAQAEVESRKADKKK